MTERTILNKKEIKLMQNDTRLALPQEGFARPAQVAFAFGVSRSTIYNWIKQGAFPTPQKMGNRMTVWPVDVIRRLLEQTRQDSTV